MARHPVKRFSGFPEGKVSAITLPDIVFTDIVPYIDDELELKVVLLVLRRLAQMRSNAAPWITPEELRDDKTVLDAVGDASITQLDTALSHIVERGILLKAEWKQADGSIEHRYLANSPRGRAAIRALRRGRNPERTTQATHPNIFTLYEQNIGPLTAILSEDLMEAEKTYPAGWIEQAFYEAVSRNKRNWRYIHTILERWRTEGKDERDKRNRESDTQRYIEGKYSDLIQH